METSVPSASKQEQLQARLLSLGISEDALEEQFVQGSGPGGQKINKTSSCVVLSYPAQGLVIKCQRTRSRELNRYYARWELCERMAERIQGEKSRRQAEAEKIRRQKRRRSRRSKQRMLDEKHRQADKKQLRKPPSLD